MKQRTGAASPKLDDDGWRKVFDLCCKSKRGGGLTPDETAFVTRAWREDPDRYKALQPRVFDETAPFGSVSRKRADG